MAKGLAVTSTLLYLEAIALAHTYEARIRIDGSAQLDPEFEVYRKALSGRLRRIGIEADTVGGEKRVD